MSENLVEISDLAFSYKNRNLVDHLNLTIQRGKITAIMGPSGSGKTTLLRLMGGLLVPDHGYVKVDGVNIHEISRRDLYQFRKKMGLLFQNSALFTHLSVFDNVAFPIREHTRLSESMIRDIVLMKLELVGLRGVASLMPAELSGGMARRVALARTIALDPAFLMYDEPFTGQDPISMGVLLRLIKQINQILQTTSVIVSHDVTETCSIADYIYLIWDGQIIESGTPQEIKESLLPQTRQFINGEADGVIPFHCQAGSFYEELFND